MTKNPTTKTREIVSEEYSPAFIYDSDKGAHGEVVSNVPTDAQLDALETIAGDGAVEPDGWIRGYHTEIPVINGVPITLIETTPALKSEREGAETCRAYNVADSLGTVEIHHAARHPENTSKVKVKPVEN